MITKKNIMEIIEKCQKQVLFNVKEIKRKN